MADVAPWHRTSLRVLVAVHHALVREALAALVERMPLVGAVDEATDAIEALDILRERRPDVALVALRAGDVLDLLLHEATRASPTMRVAVLSEFLDAGPVHDARRAGAAGHCR